MADADGAYVLPEQYLPGNYYTLSARRTDTYASTRSMNVIVPQDTTVDFTLGYRLSGQFDEIAVSTTSGPAVVTLSLTSYAPVPGIRGQTGGASCVWVHDRRTRTRADAVFETELQDGASHWAFQVVVPQNSVDGPYDVDYGVEDCASGTNLGDWTPSVSRFYVRNEPPGQDAVAPTSHFDTKDGSILVDAYVLVPVIRGSSSDDASGVDSAEVTIVRDGSPDMMWHASGRLSCAGTDRRNCNWTAAVPSPLFGGPILPGWYIATASSRDLAGNIETAGPSIRILIV